MTTITTLKPNALWQHFANFCAIPRPSKHETAIIDFYENYAKQNGYESFKDKAGNLIIRKPASKGYENSPKIILQGHVDMVAQKTKDHPHDFNKDPIQPIIKDGWVYANQTTLGADNAIGVAASLAILDDPSAIHGDLEILLTVDEEAGMGGARALSADCLQGDYLFNLDSEQWGECCVGCAGGADIQITHNFKYNNINHASAWKLSVSGLKGGHSGIDIHTGRGSASPLLAEVLYEFPHAINLASFEGGTLRNVIARDAFAEFAIDDAHLADLKAHVEKMQATLRSRLQIVDENICLSLEPTSISQALSASDSKTILATLHLLPHGVLRQSVAVEGVVETSCNIGVVRLNPQQGLAIHLMARSLAMQGLYYVYAKARAVADLVGMTCKMFNEYPGWEPRITSKALDTLLASYQEITGEKMHVSVVHAGLETGLIGSKYPNLEMVSFGPTITGAHSPNEGVEIASVEKFYDLLKAVLKKIAS